MEGLGGAVVKAPRKYLYAGLALPVLILAIPAGSLYFESGNGTKCISCHEMQGVYDKWHVSSHRGIGCEQCHGDALTTDVAFHWNNISRAYQHLRGNLPEQVGFGNKYVQQMNDRCAGCHRAEYAAWKSGPHSATYERIFLDKKYNAENMLMDDCLRCHGMYFAGGVFDLVTPVDRKGPWQLKQPEMSGAPSIPCLSCHTMHKRGEQRTKVGPEGAVPGPSQQTAAPSLALFDRRTQESIPVGDLPLPAMMDGSRPVKMSTDQRQALCYQCHAPDFTRQVGSGDDRTGIGVHEGISCLACHARHTQQTRASCGTCHPKMSNCGIDVEKMDTTFKSRTSKHNVHWVKCVDCHPAGVPPRKAKPGATALARSD